jgi:hypothetical protein
MQQSRRVLIKRAWWDAACSKSADPPIALGAGTSSVRGATAADRREPVSATKQLGARQVGSRRQGERSLRRRPIGGALTAGIRPTDSDVHGAARPAHQPFSTIADFISIQRILTEKTVHPRSTRTSSTTKRHRRGLARAGSSDRHHRPQRGHHHHLAARMYIASPGFRAPRPVREPGARVCQVPR